ncbi:dihydrofolate reductase family protein [Flavobacterium sp. RHBU_24]|uniref:dihydrofolate reductase family protein n=1 Tax=Flavobacterium sp. RHBU_24 TaxID=3391185 RepID=UPI00398497F2
MRKVKLQMQVSIDSFVAGPNGEMDWVEWNWGDDINAYVGAITEPVSTIIIGRKLAEGFIPYWKDAAEKDEPIKGAEKLNATPKVVFTKTLESNPWENTILAKGPLEDEIAKLKAEEGGDIIAYGGGTFVSSLIKAGLIDEYYLLVNPTIIGKGMPVFEEVTEKKPLKLIESKAFDCGITALHYTKP